MFDFFKRKKNKEEIKEEQEIEEDSEVIESSQSYKEVEEFVEEKEIDESRYHSYENETDSDNETEFIDDNLDSLNEAEEVDIDNSESLDNEDVGFFAKIKKGLTKTRDQFSQGLTNLFTRNVKIDDDLYDELEEILISADIGMTSTVEIVDELRDEIKKRSIKEADQIYPVLKEIMTEKLDEKNLDNNLNIEKNNLSVILVIGVNGVGKTTTIGKLAYNLKNEGKNVMLAAADTFRAAAIEQLGEWAEKSDLEMISHKEGSDPSAVIFDAIKSAKAKNADVLICDTAGRLHNKKNLMKELEKINKTIDTHAKGASRDNLLVLDATTGQNAVSQLREFKNVTDISGLILTKLDGTAKGGVIFPLQVELEVPVKYIGVGEGINDLEKFESKTFVEAMF
ncbi:MAG: signal recognition particle-docking protein FtsY [Anaerococcus sp.]|uniref:signal recognition particle-docking protein FtsY n=1 Tax=Anaerococcus sp. TaxID=1872515 RepID=UPI0026028CF5|nr:signal recognition particle-docking protein FtsY [Anaerococcus sp.]MCI5971826.1 signal recognition particle-docking protein FtsY [Anaerococcus sp.]MDD6918992.1 signal recognition particle-docking protein FtsY [Peptoniphilaceae bacterium]MDY2928316.1 signal recognition particle-docking protein FtsY [Anaerococcus sp.]